jgi:hypothetical protein
MDKSFLNYNYLYYNYVSVSHHCWMNVGNTAVYKPLYI